MSRTIDSRVVEMRFDNKQFEANAKETVGTLGKLKEALKLPDTTKALDGLNKSVKGVSLDGIAAGIETLNKRFSTLGIVGMRVISNITDALMGKLNTAVNFVTDSIISGGVKRAMNIENAHFQLQALLKDETKVQAVMANAMESVDGTAYAYDEAAKAAAQFAASGVQAGEDMLNALKGITGVAAMTNSDFEGISRIFTTVAGNGRLMGDQLLQLSARGLNAASTIADYFREVQGQSEMTEAAVREMVSSGEISFKIFSDAMTWAFGDSAKRANETFTGSLSNMKSALARIGAGFFSPFIEQNGEMVKLFNALRIKINDVKSALVFDEQRSAIAGLAENSRLTNEQLSNMFETIKERGHVSGEEMKLLANNSVHASEVLMKYINGVTDGSIRASYAITSAVSEFTEGTEVSISDVRRLVEEGKVDLAMFTSAMEHEFGTEKTLSKQFTDFFLDQIHSIVEAINNIDVSKPMEAFYHVVEATKNVAKGLLTVLRPIGKAFSEVFLSFDADGVIRFSEAIERLTLKMKLSEKGSKNLHDAAKGLFDVIKLGANIFVKLLSAIVPINKPILETADGFLGLAGAIGRALTSITEGVKSSYVLERVFSMLSNGFYAAMKGLSDLIRGIKGFVDSIFELEGTEKLINAISNAFKKLRDFAIPYIDQFLIGIEDIIRSFLNLGDVNFDDVLEGISNAFSNLALVIDRFSFKTVENAFGALRNKIKSLESLFKSGDGFFDFLSNAKKYGEELKEALSWDGIMSRIDHIMEVFDKFFVWTKEVLGPTFKDFSVGSALAVGGGFGIIYALVKAAKALENVSGALRSIPKLLGSIGSTLTAYQNNLKADTLIKIAGAIAILAGAIVLLSFIDSKKLLATAGVLGVVGAAFMYGVVSLLNAMNKGWELNNALTIFAKGFSKAANNLTKAIKIKAIGNAVKSFATSIVLIAGTMIALGLMYDKNSTSLMNGAALVALIASAMIGIMGSMSLLGNMLQGDGMRNFAIASLGVVFLSSSLTMIVATLNKLFNMKFPFGWNQRVYLLRDMLIGIGALALVMSAAARLSGDSKMASSTILAMSAMLMVTVLSLNKLFSMKFPHGWSQKVDVLKDIFKQISILMIAMGLAVKLADGPIKAASTILATCVFIGAIVTSLLVLTIMPIEKLTAGAIALGVILTALGIALLGANKSSPDAYKSVLAMALTAGAIAAALGVLSMVNWLSLMKAAIALGGVIGVLSVAFNQVSKITNDKAWIAIASMVAAVVSIGASLFALSKQPWDSLLASAASMSLVLAAMSGAFAIISKSKPNNESVIAFVASAVSLIPIAAAIKILSSVSWRSLLPAVLALGGTVAAMVGVLYLLAQFPTTIVGVGAFVSAALSLIPIAAAIRILSGLRWEDAVTGLLTLAGGLTVIGVAAVMLGPVAPRIIALSSALLSFGAAIAVVGVGIAAFVASLGLAFYAIQQIPQLFTIFQQFGAVIKSTISNVIASVLSGLTFLSNGLKTIGSTILNFITGLFGFLSSNTFVGIGLNIVSGLVSGLFAGLSSLLASIKTIGLTIVEGIKNVLGIHSPSLVMRQLGLYTTEGFAMGLGDGQPLVDGALGMVFGDITGKINTSSLFESGNDATKNFVAGLLVGKQNVDSAASQVIDPSNADVSGFSTLAARGASNLASSLQGEKPMVDDSIAQLLNMSGVDLSSFNQLGINSSNNFASGLMSGKTDVQSMISQMMDPGSANTDKFSEVGETAVGKLADRLQNGKPTIDDSIAQLLNTSGIDISGFDVLGVNSSENFAAGLLSGQGNVQTTMSQMIDPSGVDISGFATLGTSASDHFIDGFKIGATNSANAAAVEVANTLKNALFTEISAIDPTEPGITIMDKFLNVFTSNDSKIVSAFRKFASDVRSVIDSEFANISESMIKIGENVVTGLINGLNNKKRDLQAAASDLGNTVDNAVRKTLEIHSPSKVMEERGEQAGEGFVDGIESKTGDVKKASTDMGKAATDGLAESLISGNENVQKALNESLIGEQNYWNSWNDIAEDGIDDAEELNEELINDTEETSNNLKKINNRRVSDEKDHWNNVITVKRQGAEEEKKVYESMVMYSKETLDEITKVYEEYTSKFESTRDSLVKSIGLFDEVTKKEAIGKDQLTSNLEQQISLYEKFAEQWAILNERIDNEPLLEELKSLGVDSVDQLQVINSMTDEELSYYVDLYNQKIAAASEAATSQLGLMQQQTEAKISELLGATYSQISLVDFSHVFDGTMASLNQFAVEIFVPMENAAKEAVTKGKDIGTGFGTGIKESFAEVPGILVEAISAATMQVGDNSKSIGENITTGISEGMKGKSDEISATASAVMKDIISSLESAGEIHSPSELAKRAIGEMITAGIAIGMTENTESTDQASKMVIDNIVKSFEGSKSILQTAGKSITDAIITSFTNSKEEFGSAGNDNITFLLTKFLERTQDAISTTNEFANSMIKALRDKVKDFEERGRDSANGFINTIKTFFGEATTTGFTLANSALSAIVSLLPKFYEAGDNAGKGLVRGIENNMLEATAAGRRIARAAYEAAMAELDEESPSKKMFQVGDYAGIGFVNGILANVAKSEAAGGELGGSVLDGADKAIKTISQVVEDGFDVDPVVYPTVDLTGVEESVADINRMFNNAIKISTEKAESAAMSIRQSKEFKSAGSMSDTQNDRESSENKTGNTYQFIQTNNSPKALSRIEIYRQTRNQFSQFREAIENQ